MFIKNASLFPYERFEENIFFSNKILFTSFFQNISGKLSYFALNLQIENQNAFQLSGGILREIFVFGK